jgi:hypothetical protein
MYSLVSHFLSSQANDRGLRSYYPIGDASTLGGIFPSYAIQAQIAARIQDSNRRA